jgi:hypothetical protein
VIPAAFVSVQHGGRCQHVPEAEPREFLLV